MSQLGRETSPMSSKPTAVVLLSGGLDSAVTMAVARKRGHDVYALSVRYGQRHDQELASAARQARAQGAVCHEVVDLGDLGRLVCGATALVTGTSLAVPKDGLDAQEGRIPVTYVPARNTVFLSLALSWAEAVGARSLWLGVNAVDYSGYPDCRPAFIEAFSRLAGLATKAGRGAFAIHTPLIGLHKHEIVALGHHLGVDLADTVSCYDPEQGDDGSARACGACDSCRLRREGFVRAGIEDPTRYVGPPP